jgi:hypothetical protein
MVYDAQNGLCQSSEILNNQNTQRFGNWTCSLIQVRGGRHLPLSEGPRGPETE